MLHYQLTTDHLHYDCILREKKVLATTLLSTKLQTGANERYDLQRDQYIEFSGSKLVIQT